MIPAVSKSAGAEVSVCTAYWETAMVSAALPSHGAFPLPSTIQRAVRLWHGYTDIDYSLNTHRHTFHLQMQKWNDIAHITHTQSYI